MMKKSNSGYTIIELLAVVSILVIISGIITGILYSTLRGSNKTKITTEITQNGNYVLSVISATVIDSRNVIQIGDEDIQDCTASPSGTSITLERLSGGTTTLACSGGTISSNSASLIDTTTVQVVEDTCFFYCSQLTNDPYAIPIVGVVFRLEEANTGQAESQASASFGTSVSIRNFLP